MMNNEKVAGPDEVRRFWTDIMFDEYKNLVQRIKASELMAKSYGMFRDYVQPSYVQPSYEDESIYEEIKNLPTEELMRMAYGEEY